MNRLRRISMLCRVGIVYAWFGGSIAVTTYLVVPLARWAGIGPRDEDLLTQRCLHYAARSLRAVVVGLGILELTQSGMERLTRGGPLLVVANHPSSLDASFLIAWMPQVDNVAERQWANAPVIGAAIAKAGHLRNDHPRAVIEDGVRRLEAGRRLLIFPEGTRSPAGALHPFHRGAARLALGSGCDIVPVVIRCDPPFGLKGRPWYDIPSETPKMSITVGDAIAVEQYLDGGESPGVAARKVTRGLREYFLRELNYADC